MPEPVNRRQEISGILYLTMAVLLAVSYYVPAAKTGTLGTVLVTAGHALIGIAAFALPMLFFYMALERFLASQPRMTTERFRYVGLLLLCSASLLHTLTIDGEAFRQLALNEAAEPSAVRSLGVLLRSAVDHSAYAGLSGLKSGGLLGGILSQALSALAGSTGAAIILGALILALLVLLFNVSYARAINRTAQAINTTRVRMNDAMRTSVQTMRLNAETDRMERSRSRAGYDLRVGPAADPAEAGMLAMQMPGPADGDRAGAPMAGGFVQVGSGQPADGTTAVDGGNPAGRTSFWNSLFHPRGRAARSQDHSSAGAAGNALAGASSTDDGLDVPEFLRQAAQPVAAGDSGGFTLMPDTAESAATVQAAAGAGDRFAEDGDELDFTGVLPAGVHRVDETGPDRGGQAQGTGRHARSGRTGTDGSGDAADAVALIADGKDGVRQPRRVQADQIPLPYQKPPLYLLNSDTAAGVKQNLQRIPELGRKLEATLKSFGVDAKVVNYTAGATITRFELTPGPGVKVSKIVSLADDIALNLAAMGVRIEAPIPGKSAIGIEIPNKETTPVLLRPLLESPEFTRAGAPLTAALGRDIQGTPILCDLARMPHLLIAGATGSGKSVCLNTILMSILYRCSPDDVKLLMIDPKVVELSMYNGIPHLLSPVVTDPRKAANTLLWAVNEMVRRYGLFAEKSVRDIHGYQSSAKENPDEFEPMPLILLVIDELADLMSTTPTEVEDAIARLTAMARAAGIHLIIATQRPSVDVITGVIKANIPSRIAFAVASQVDSRTILDTGGAEKLLGKGDMLYFPQSLAKPLRGQGAFVSDGEVEKVLAFIKSHSVSGYDPSITEAIMTASTGSTKGGDNGDQDELLPQAAEIVVEAGYASVSLLQRRMNVGYPRAARLIDRMQEKGYVGPFEGSKPRKVILTVVQLMELKNRGEL